MFECMTPKFLLPDDRAAVKQVIFRPCHSFGGGHFRGIRLQWWVSIKPGQLNAFVGRKLPIPQRLQPGNSHVLDLSRPFLVGDMVPNGVDVATGLLRFSGQQFPRFPVNLLMPLGKPLNQFLRDAPNFKIPARIVLNAVTKTNQRLGQFMVIDLNREFFGHQHFASFQCLPTVLD